MCPRLLFHDFSAPPKNRGTWWMLFAKRWVEGAGLAQPTAIGGFWRLAAFWPIRNRPSRSGYCPRLFSAAPQKWEKNGFYATHGGSRQQWLTTDLRLATAKWLWPKSMLKTQKWQLPTAALATKRQRSFTVRPAGQKSHVTKQKRPYSIKGGPRTMCD